MGQVWESLAGREGGGREDGQGQHQWDRELVWSWWGQESMCYSRAQVALAGWLGQEAMTDSWRFRERHIHHTIYYLVKAQVALAGQATRCP